jgi:hypothetical protein
MPPSEDSLVRHPRRVRAPPSLPCAKPEQALTVTVTGMPQETVFVRDKVFVAPGKHEARIWGRLSLVRVYVAHPPFSLPPPQRRNAPRNLVAAFRRRMQVRTLPSAVSQPSTATAAEHAGEQPWEGWEHALLTENDCFISWLPHSKVRRGPHTHRHTHTRARAHASAEN